MTFFRKINANKLNLFLDIALALAFVVEMEARFTGLHYHEVLGVLIAAAFLVHLLFHWRWVTGVTRQFIQTPFRLHEARFKYLLNVAVLIVSGVAIVTGIMISSTLGFTLSLATNVYNAAFYLHLGSSGLSLLLIGLHIAVDWKWIAANAKKYLFPFGSLRKKTPLRGPLIFVALVALVGFGFAITGRFSDPFGFFQAFQFLQSSNVQAATVTHSAGSHIHNSGSGGLGTPAYHAQASHSQAGGRASDRIAWSYFGAVLFDSWMLFAIIACFILAQLTLGFLIYRFRSHKSAEISA